MSANPLNFDNYPQRPHGGVLVDQVVPQDQQPAALERARSLPAIRVDLEAVITIEMIATGVLSPNTGFMNEADYLSVLDHGRLADGTVWPVPLSFAPSGDRNRKVIAGLSIGDEIALVDYRNEPVAIMEISDLFDYDKTHRASKLFGTTDRSHPGVDSIYERMGERALGGPIQLLQRASWGPFEKLRRAPADIWREFYEVQQFRSVAGFITGANPLHRGHEYIHRNALEEIDGLFLQPLVEMAKREYVRHEYRMLSYRSVIESYYPKDRAILSPLRVTYIFAGPREAVLHALIMKNYGCTHALIGRDHAGISDFYDKYASHTVFDEFTPQELGIDVRLFHEVFYCTRCASHATVQTCPHDERFRLNISGTGIREMLRHGVIPPKEVVRPESARIAMQGVQPKGLDENQKGTLPVAKVIQSMFPFYLTHSRLGGTMRQTPLTPEELTARDLEVAIMDVRENASKIYGDIYQEYRLQADHNAQVQPAWIIDSHVAMRKQQEMVIENLQEKVDDAPEQTSNEFMYQNKEEAQRELTAANRQLELSPAIIGEEDRHKQVWNPLPYKRYRGIDD